MAIYAQRAAVEAGYPVIWDYHVVLFVRREGWRVWDLDSALGLDVPLATYLAASFPPLGNPPGYAPRFRVMTAADFRAGLATDRRHMRGPDGWHQPPPPWPAIGEGFTLDRLLDLTDAASPGVVCGLGALPATLEAVVSRG